MMGAKEFHNLYYSPEWEEKTPQGDLYARGTASERSDGSYSVYDGAGNYMGQLCPTGELVYAGEPSPYKESFLLSAAEAFLGPAEA